MARGVLLAAPEHHWSCPNCDVQHVTREARPHTPFHPCRGVAGLTAPFVPDGTRAKVTAELRQDYINGDTVQLDADGRPVMALVTTRDDGQDCTVFAPTATAKVG